MKHIIVLPYKCGDLPELESNKTLGKHGPVFTFWDGDQVVACAGATIFWEGVAEVWLTPACDLSKYGREVTIWTRKVLKMFHDTYGLWRMQADVVASNEKACEFVKHYGFRAEGLMRRYDALGRDCIRYARVA